eukprot:3894204-Prymnesium_polylepis.3
MVGANLGRTRQQLRHHRRLCLATWQRLPLRNALGAAGSMTCRGHTTMRANLPRTRQQLMKQGWYACVCRRLFPRPPMRPATTMIELSRPCDPQSAPSTHSHFTRKEPLHQPNRARFGDIPYPCGDHCSVQA